MRPVFLTIVILLSLTQTPIRTSAQQPAAHVNEGTVYEVAAQLRCVVCQNLSVADSPSEMANQMRTIVRERLAAGESPDQVIQYFVDKYGQWILLSPRRQGFTLLVWIVPAVATLVGLGLAALLVRTWTRRRTARRPARPAVDAAMRERIQREMEAER
jgi:cytochrome c-type biogenesis protein CcmH